MAAGFRFTVDGINDVLGRLKDLDRKVRTKLLRSSLGEGSKLLLREMKQRAPRGKEKLLWKSLGRKTKVYRNSGVVVVIVGPRTGFDKEIGTRVRGKSKGQPFSQSPTRISHLVEKGHAGRSPAAAHPFEEPAYRANQSRIQELVKQAILAGLEA